MFLKSYFCKHVLNDLPFQSLEFKINWKIKINIDASGKDLPPLEPGGLNNKHFGRKPFLAKKNIFSAKNIFGQKHFGQKTFSTKNIFDQKIFSTKKYFQPKKIDQKTFSIKKTYSAKKTFRSKKWAKNIFGQKTFSRKKTFSTKKHFRPKNYFRQKKTCSTKNTFSTKNPFMPKNIFCKHFLNHIFVSMVFKVMVPNHGIKVTFSNILFLRHCRKMSVRGAIWNSINLIFFFFLKERKKFLV